MNLRRRELRTREAAKQSLVADLQRAKRDLVEGNRKGHRFEVFLFFTVLIFEFSSFAISKFSNSR